jgi:hypothetical protein
VGGLQAELHYASIMFLIQWESTRGVMGIECQDETLGVFRYKNLCSLVAAGRQEIDGSHQWMQSAEFVSRHDLDNPFLGFDHNSQLSIRHAHRVSLNVYPLQCPAYFAKQMTLFLFAQEESCRARSHRAIRQRHGKLP